MLLTFKIVLFIFLFIFGMGTIGAPDKDRRLQCASVTIASITALVILFVVG